MKRYSGRAPLVEHIPLESAQEFFKSLSPGGKYIEFSEREASQQGFRGHSDARYKLIPSALRVAGSPPLHNLTCSWPISEAEKDSNVLQLIREHQVLLQFFNVADRSGLPIPEDSQRLRRELDRVFFAIVRARTKLRDGEDTEIASEWPSDPLLSLMGLAQHHGIPTRLLDWTRRADVAMYFAAAERLRTPNETEGRLSVWVMNLRQLNVWHHRQVVEEGRTDATRLVEIVTAPRAGNPNLHAQAGFFTLLNKRVFSASGKVDRRPLDEVLQDYYDEFWERQFNYPVFHQFTLPGSECRELLWILERHRTNPGALFPGFDGVVKEVVHAAKMRVGWDMESHDCLQPVHQLRMSVVRKDEKTGFTLADED